MKLCTGCKTEKPESGFSKNRGARDGLDSRCKVCRRLYYLENKTEILQQQKEYNLTAAGKTTNKRSKAKSSRTVDGYLRKTFSDMKQRCNNPKAHNYKWYGGRGIQVLFKSVDKFIDYVTAVLQIDPRRLTIDRINNNGHYEKGNIRFVTRAENNRNRPKRTE